MRKSRPTVIATFELGGHRHELYPGDVVCVRVTGELRLADTTAGQSVVEGHVPPERLSLIVDLSELDSIEPDVLAQTRAATLFCVAVVVSGFGQRSLYSMATRMFGETPNQPTRFFIDEDAAFDWVEDLKRTRKEDVLRS